MSLASPLNPLNTRHENICTYGGTFGVLISLTCFIQHLVVANPDVWLTTAMIPAYLFAIIAFLFLAFQKPVAIWLLIVSVSFSFIIEAIWMISAAFSLIVLILLMYHVVIIVVLFVDEIPKKLIQKRRAEIEEEMKWADKI